MRRTTRRAMLDTECSIQRSLEVIGDPWTVLVLREAFSGGTRFVDFQTRLGISTDLLTDRLARLVEAGIMERRPYSEPGKRARNGYHLTPAGEDLRVVLGSLQQWGDLHRPHEAGPSVERRSRETGEHLAVAFVNETGNAVPLEEVVFVWTRPGTEAAAHESEPALSESQAAPSESEPAASESEPAPSEGEPATTENTAAEPETAPA
ncbi:helix-turn-helix domain-containing protein [Sphaerisporangium sp. NPDC005288]|uniref:winged helix-turn-helix transcriptional regulator n=1 Tax=Sphaerisporangium sp. NPDC005288 TaxID=3155114 RepID=UPI0033AA6751